MNIVKKHPFAISMVGLVAAYLVFYGVSALLSPYFPDEGLRNNNFVLGEPSPLSSLVEEDGVGEGWTLEGASVENGVVSLSENAVISSPEISNIGAKLALIEGNDLPFTVEGYIGDKKMEEGEVAKIGDWYGYRFTLSYVRLSKVRFIYTGSAFSGALNLSVNLIVS